MAFRVDGDSHAEELRRMVRGGFPQFYTFGGHTIDGVLENVATLIDTIFEVSLVKSVTGLSAALAWSRREEEEFIRTQVSDWYSDHRPGALAHAKEVLQRCASDEGSDIHLAMLNERTMSWRLVR